MAYNGYLIKVGSYIIPFKYIKFNTFQSFMSITDLDSYRDANGELHRNALSHIVCKCEFETPAMLTTEDFADLMSNIRSNYTLASERKATCSVYVAEIDDYIEQDMYMPDPQPTFYSVHTGKLEMNPCRLAFIGY